MDSNIQSIILLHLTYADGVCMPLQLEANSWVTIQPSEKGGHARDARRHGGTSLTWVYKARVLKFKAGRGSSNI